MTSRRGGEERDFIRGKGKIPFVNFCKKFNRVNKDMSIFEVIYKIIGIVAALLLPMFPGCLAVGLLLPELKTQKILYGILGLIIGHTLLSSITYILWFSAGVKITLLLFLIVLGILSILFYAFLLRRGRQCRSSCLTEEHQNGIEKLKHRYIFIFLVAVSIIYFLIVGITSFSESVSDWPGIGIYGLKAKIIYYAGSCVNLFNNKEIAYSHPEYPLGYALMITWCCQMVGNFYNALLKIIPLFWGVIAFLTIFQVGRSISGRRNTALLFALFAASTTTYLNCCIKMYAEMILISIIVSAFYCLTEFMRTKDKREKHGLFLLGMVLLIFSCWYKTEGMLYLLAAICGLAIFAFRDIREILKNKRFKAFIILVSAVTLAVFPWCITKLAYGLHSRDFSTKAFCITGKTRFADISGKFLHEYLFNWYNVGICCSFMLITLVLFLREEHFRIFSFTCLRKLLFFHAVKKHLIINRQIYFVIFSSLFVVSVYYTAYFASVMPLWWHLQAVKRILLIPGILVCLILLSNCVKEV